jgi:hypothetical protein
MIAENPKEWDNHLPYAMMAYRATPHSSTGYSPNQMMLGREVLMPLDVMYGLPPGEPELHSCPTEYTEWLRTTLRQAHEMARSNNQQALKSQKKYYDVGKSDINLQVGTWVYWRVKVKKAKFDPDYAGPWCIVRQLNSCLYELSPHCDGPRKVVHVDELKVCTGAHPAKFVEDRAKTVSTQTELVHVQEPSCAKQDPQVSTPVGEQRTPGTQGSPTTSSKEVKDSRNRASKKSPGPRNLETKAKNPDLEGKLDKKATNLNLDKETLVKGKHTGVDKGSPTSLNPNAGVSNPKVVPIPKTRAGIEVKRPAKYLT